MLCFMDSRRFSTLYEGGSCVICTGLASINKQQHYKLTSDISEEVDLLGEVST